MPLKLPSGAYKSVKPKAPKKPKAHKATKAKKSKKAKVKKPAAAKAFSEQTATTGAEHPTTAGLPLSGVGSAAGASPRALLELSGFSAPSGGTVGLGGAILDLVGEGQLTVAHALAAWTHEQNRLANRAWRRPGGLQRMGGL
jgi:hypothetical protein